MRSVFGVLLRVALRTRVLAAAVAAIACPACGNYGTDTAGGHVPSVGGLPSIGGGRKKFTAAVNARLIDVETGEIVWADEARDSAQKGSIRVGGFGGGSDSDAMFDKVLKPVVVQLVSSLKAADI